MFVHTMAVALVASMWQQQLPSPPARADSPPYGFDFPFTHQPTGRFSNGLNFPDLISESMRLEPTLPYLNPELNGQKLLNGANFASAGIGILNDTGIQFKLYELGARRVLVTGIGPLGCVPAELAYSTSRSGDVHRSHKELRQYSILCSFKCF
ncbi:hypothetical protein GH714_025362 [Hevea brasiliensis]|uniref:GDSL esterase/lipase n=1 Tax=Hevea brasiliensis TaxID=3981 RepID=A0A6A6M0G6_HEVBR|nr:hypothetical protein GH714_025362 [Hevea brasiliensis]